jgi:hypothetical protein
VFINQEKSCAYSLASQQIQQWWSNLRIRTIVECQVNHLVARMRQTPYGNIIVRQIEKKPERSDARESVVTPAAIRITTRTMEDRLQR